MVAKTYSRPQEAMYSSRMQTQESTLVYPEIRKHLAPQYRYLPAEYIEQIVAEQFGEGVDAQDVEDLFGDIGNFVKSAGNTVAKALPSVLPVAAAALPVAGTVVGSVLGGPMGGMLGSTLGGLAGKAVGSIPHGPTPAAASTVSNILGTAGSVVGGLMGGGAPGGAAGSVLGGLLGGAPGGMPGGAAMKLFRSLLDPKVLGGLQAMAMGPAGRPSIPVAGTQVPVGAFANLIQSLANQASAEQEAYQAKMRGGSAEYLVNSEGLPLVDVASPEQRAAALLSLLQQESLQQQFQQRPKQPQSLRFQEDIEDLDEYYDAIELAQLHAELEDLEVY